MEWTEASVEGMARFVRRLWRVVNEVVEKAPRGRSRREGALARKAHATIAKVTDDIGRRFAFNTGDRGGDGARQRALARHAVAATRASPPRRRSR